MVPWSFTEFPFDFMEIGLKDLQIALQVVELVGTFKSIIREDCKNLTNAKIRPRSMSPVETYPGRGGFCIRS